MSWLYLLIAVIADVAGITAMKMCEGFTRIIPSIIVVISYLIFFMSFSLALKKLELGVVYPIWVGLGTIAITCISVTVFDEPMNAWKAGCILLILLGVLGLRLSPTA